MASKVEIANRALTKLGEERILLLTDDLKAARVMNSMFDLVRDAEIRRFNWNFAMKRDSLLALVDAPAWGFKYQYPLPADFLHLVQVNEYYVRTNVTYRGQWAVEAGKILTDYDAPLKVRYLSRVTDTALFDPLFVEVLACKLAMEACETLTQSESKMGRAAEQYKFAVTEALRQDAIENPPDEIPNGSWLDSRLSGGSFYASGQEWAAYPGGFVV